MEKCFPSCLCTHYHMHRQCSIAQWSIYYTHTLDSVTHSLTRAKHKLVRIGPLSLAGTYCPVSASVKGSYLVVLDRSGTGVRLVVKSLSLFSPLSLVKKCKGSQCNDGYREKMRLVPSQVKTAYVLRISKGAHVCHLRLKL